MVLLGWLLGMQDARGPMVLMLATNGVNILLDLWFVLGLGLGVAGVAAATVCAEYGGLALGLWLVWRRLAPRAWRLELARDPRARRLPPPARGQPRHHAAQPEPRGGVPDLHRAELAPGRAAARRQRRAAQFPDLRRLRPRRLRPCRRGDGRPPPRRRQPRGLPRRGPRQPGLGAGARRRCWRSPSCSAAGRRSRS